MACWAIGPNTHRIDPKLRGVLEIYLSSSHCSYAFKRPELLKTKLGTSGFVVSTSTKVLTGGASAASGASQTRPRPALLTGSGEAKAHDQLTLFDRFGGHAGVAEPMTDEEYQNELHRATERQPPRTTTPREGLSTWVLLSGSESSEMKSESTSLLAASRRVARPARHDGGRVRHDTDEHVRARHDQPARAGHDRRYGGGWYVYVQVLLSDAGAPLQHDGAGAEETARLVPLDTETGTAARLSAANPRRVFVDGLRSTQLGPGRQLG